MIFTLCRPSLKTFLPWPGIVLSPSGSMHAVVKIKYRGSLSRGSSLRGNWTRISQNRRRPTESFGHQSVAPPLRPFDHSVTHFSFLCRCPGANVCERVQNIIIYIIHTIHHNIYICIMTFIHILISIMCECVRSMG